MGAAGHARTDARLRFGAAGPGACTPPAAPKGTIVSVHVLTPYEVTRALALRDLRAGKVLTEALAAKLQAATQEYKELER